MHIDKYLPTFDVHEIHAVGVNAEAASVYNVLRSSRLRESIIIRLLFVLRGMPAAVRHPSRSPDMPGTTLEELLKNGFILLEDDPPNEIVLGLVGKFWSLSGCIQRMDADAFAGFRKHGFAKAVWNFRIAARPDGGTHLSTETRVACTDEASRWKFRLYWFVVRPFSGLIRKEALRIIRHDAEHHQPASAAALP